MQFHSYIFLYTSGWGILKRDRKEFLEIINSSKKVKVCGYTILGLKSTGNIMLWFQSDSLEEIQDLINELKHTKLGKGLLITHTLFGMVRPTQYSKESKKYLDTDRKGGKYLIIYPFNKTKEWYQLSFEKRKNLMWGHVQVGKKYPEIEQLLLYSYGIDDNEFIVSYETDDLLKFQSLVMELRSDKVRAYTQKDTPIFTCIYKPLKEILNYL